jgi:serpin B
MTRREWISSVPLGLALFDQGKDPVTDQTGETAKTAAAGLATFGLRLLRERSGRQPRENVFLSPLSIALALQMAESGAAGSTRSAMNKVLAVSDTGAAALNASLRSHYPDQLHIANALWADRRFILAPDYVKLCNDLFGARAATLDFKDPRAAAEINDWVKQETQGKIADIVSAGAVANAAVILTNAVYFAAAWRKEFQPSQTQTGEFHPAGGGSKSLPMMQQQRVTGAYRSGNAFEGAVLPYKNPGIFLYGLLPRDGKSVADVLESLDAGSLTAGRSEYDLDLKLPRFNLDFSASLASDLQRMGMDAAFHYPPADFSRMGSGPFFISDVMHKTRLEVDEKGTVAAAATALTMTATAMMQPRPVKTLVFDRPFVVLIGDSQSGALLFAGVIQNP